VVSVITAVHPAAAGYLADAYASLVAQELPDGAHWEWLVQEDGQTGLLADLPEDPRIRGGAGRPGGPGVARTLALARAGGALVRVLDADDRLTPGALARDVAALIAQPDAGFVTSAALDLRPDGTTAAAPRPTPTGPLARGTVLAHWRGHSYRLPVHPATVCIRRDLLLALGGWMALPASEDTGLLLAANAVTDGYHLAEPSLLYRKWDGQATAQPAHTDPDELADRIRLIEQRAGALTSFASPRVGSGLGTTPDRVVAGQRPSTFIVPALAPRRAPSQGQIGHDAEFDGAAMAVDDVAQLHQHDSPALRGEHPVQRDRRQ
jgi:hypothetical protein